MEEGEETSVKNFYLLLSYFLLSFAFFLPSRPLVVLFFIWTARGTLAELLFGAVVWSVPALGSLVI
jgi:hypothetical protein